MLHSLSGEHGKAIVAQLAKLIVQSPWKVPRTLIEKLAVDMSRIASRDHLEHDRRFLWDIIDLKRNFKIPVIAFSDNWQMDTITPIPQKLVRQLRNMEIEYPLMVAWNNEPHVVVRYSTESGEELQIGQRHDNLDLVGLSLAPAKYFDLER